MNYVFVEWKSEEKSGIQVENIFLFYEKNAKSITLLFRKMSRLCLTNNLESEILLTKLFILMLHIFYYYFFITLFVFVLCCGKIFVLANTWVVVSWILHSFIWIKFIVQYYYLQHEIYYSRWFMELWKSHYKKKSLWSYYWYSFRYNSSRNVNSRCVTLCHMSLSPHKTSSVFFSVIIIFI